MITKLVESIRDISGPLTNLLLLPWILKLIVDMVDYSTPLLTKKLYCVSPKNKIVLLSYQKLPENFLENINTNPGNPGDKYKSNL